MNDALDMIVAGVMVLGTIGAYSLIFVAALQPCAHFEYRWKKKEDKP